MEEKTILEIQQEIAELRATMEKRITGIYDLLTSMYKEPSRSELKTRMFLEHLPRWISTLGNRAWEAYQNEQEMRKSKAEAEKKPLELVLEIARKKVL